MPVSPARVAAFEILLRIDQADSYASELLHAQRLAKLSREDHGLSTELVMGVLRWRSVLDQRISEYLTQPFAKLDLEVLTALRLGAYQMLFLDRIPNHAAVDGSVELIKRARKRSAAGMVNAVLRRLSNDFHFSQQQREGGHPAEQLQLAAHPQWLVERWAEVSEKICAYDQLAPKTTIRINDCELVEELRREGVTLKPGSLLTSASSADRGYITRTKAFRERRLIIQDEASQLVALLVGKGDSLLDCCAAPGGKTRILAEQNPKSSVTAVELHPHRAALLKKLVPLENVRVISGDVRRLPLAMKFDRVLLDAPCSGTGTLARNPEIKWRLKLEDIPRLQAYQLEILLSAMNQVAARGRLVYSTCSLEPEENSDVIEKALSANSSFRVVDCRDELLRLKREGE